MNNKRRNQIMAVQAALEELGRTIHDLRAEEEEFRDNMPENLQGGERYEQAESAIEALESADNSILEAYQYLEEAILKLVRTETTFYEVNNYYE